MIIFSYARSPCIGLPQRNIYLIHMLNSNSFSYSIIVFLFYSIFVLPLRNYLILYSSIHCSVAFDNGIPSLKIFSDLDEEWSAYILHFGFLSELKVFNELFIDFCKVSYINSVAKF